MMEDDAVPMANVFLFNERDNQPFLFGRIDKEASSSALDDVVAPRVEVPSAPPAPNLRYLFIRAQSWALVHLNPSSLLWTYKLVFDYESVVWVILMRHERIFSFISRTKIMILGPRTKNRHDYNVQSLP